MSLTGDGHSLLPLLHGETPANWRNAVLVEHDGPPLSVFDPDYHQPASGNPTTYEAMRTRRFLYVEYADGERKFYDLRTDPFELHNIASRLDTTAAGSLHAELERMERCHGGKACWTAMHVAPRAQAAPPGCHAPPVAEQDSADIAPSGMWSRPQACLASALVPEEI